MRVVVSLSGRSPRVGVLADEEHVFDVKTVCKMAGLNVPSSPQAFYRHPHRYVEAVGRALSKLGRTELERLKIRRPRLLPPVPRPGKIVAIGLNYPEHAQESGWRGRPVFFQKPPTSITGPDSPIIIPRHAKMVDYEAELVVVIGRRGKDIPAGEARGYVLGFTCGNDVSARDWQFPKDLPPGRSVWYHAKGFDTFAPIGPELVTIDEIGDPHRLRIRLRLNGETMQDSNTSNMMYNVWEIVEWASKGITLEPGDLIFTGTPSGVGFRRRPQVFLKHGDLVEVEIEGIGVLRNPVVEEARLKVKGECEGGHIL